jgi:hypothetical protein
MWQRPLDMAYFQAEVLLHGLGHHHASRYRTKRPYPEHKDGSEAIAELHLKRLVARAFLPWWAERAGEEDAQMPAERRESFTELLRMLECR